MDRDSAKEELTKLKDQWRSFKEDTSQKYESYNKQINQQENVTEDKIRQLYKENERLRDAHEAAQQSAQQTQIKVHEQEVKLDSYMRDYERLFDENKRLRELTNQLREDKESALAELARNKLHQHNRVNDITDEANAKVASLESQLID